MAATTSTQKKTRDGKQVLSRHNFVLTCDNLVQIFTADRWQDIPKEVERLLSWGHNPDAIEIALLDADDPFG
ncbi:MAG: hypothetical protein KY455_09390 [Euryarchaeota archaeon]|nr:hypothetical protein [Euryarchaeota archaeon]